MNAHSEFKEQLQRIRNIQTTFHLKTVEQLKIFSITKEFVQGFYIY